MPAYDLEALRKATPQHVHIGDLPEEDRFKQLAVESKYLIDAVKVIAYRAETAMVNTLRPGVRRKDDIRSLVRSIYNTEADFVPDYEAKTLTVRLDQLANWRSARSVLRLCRELNDTRTIFPGTELRLVYELVSS
ncbi:putative transposase [Desulfogranum marinum]|uniref:putative transposase n=1 Tax=Desulfogranum marinum TaxID=453220 RepID=UPI00374D1D47